MNFKFKKLSDISFRAGILSRWVKEWLPEDVILDI